MHLLLTGANGYIGLRLLPTLLEAGHRVTAVVRDRRRFPAEDFRDLGGGLEVIEGDFLEPGGFPTLPPDLEAAYYLIHSMGAGGGFAEREARAARTFWPAAHAASWAWCRMAMRPSSISRSACAIRAGQSGSA